MKIIFEMLNMCKVSDRVAQVNKINVPVILTDTFGMGVIDEKFPVALTEYIDKQPLRIVIDMEVSEMQSKVFILAHEYGHIFQLKLGKSNTERTADYYAEFLLSFIFNSVSSLVSIDEMVKRDNEYETMIAAEIRENKKHKDVPIPVPDIKVVARTQEENAYWDRCL